MYLNKLNTYKQISLKEKIKIKYTPYLNKHSKKQKNVKCSFLIKKIVVVQFFNHLKKLTI